jgi:hypothetical protein
MMYNQTIKTMSVTWWNDKGLFCTRFFEDCDTEGPWLFTLPQRYAPDAGSGNAVQDPTPNKTVVLRVGEKHYVVPYKKYYDEEETDDEWVKLVNIGMVVDPEYPVGPEDPMKAQTTMLFITGTFRPRSLVERKDFFDKRLLERDNEGRDLKGLIYSTAAEGRALYYESISSGRTHEQAMEMIIGGRRWEPTKSGNGGLVASKSSKTKSRGMIKFGPSRGWGYVEKFKQNVQ